MLRSLLATSLLFLPLAAWAGASPEGYWKTIDDETGKPKSIVHVTVNDGVARGRIVQLFRTPDQDDDPYCDECEGDLKKQKINGMVILKGLTEDGDEWSGGSIMDPGNGKTYSAYVEVIEGGEKLKVRGYIGFSLIGRTQYWHRVSQPDPAIRSWRLHPDGSTTPLVYAEGAGSE